VMPVAAFFLRKEPEEQKHVAYRHAVIAQMGLSGPV
jgi:hypothetical protein